MLSRNGDVHSRIRSARGRYSSIAEQLVSHRFVQATAIAYRVVQVDLRHPRELLTLHELVEIDFERPLESVTRAPERAVSLVAHSDVLQPDVPEFKIGKNIVEVDSLRRH